ncbi:MAG: hypothetical protein UV78_C0001G0017 [Parcubacteria group bacterium GW2011_GWA2_43_17]|nr:MAG: hypothetical protein UV78_C0001G0017 [Parcubacteria group bacterium GW2011_GWA2_43_17]KKT91172.1 MAG: hypothetical protein UW91_C0037G0010 [Parcubacteria group bacterium GW2011_GWF2_45_11]
MPGNNNILSVNSAITAEKLNVAGEIIPFKTFKKTGNKAIRETFERGQGIFRLIPVFVPRLFGKAGKRLRLHPDDYFALGMNRGAIKERWFSSVIPANNGPLAAKDEGMSYVNAITDKMEDKFLLRDAVHELGQSLIGKDLLDKHGMWPMYSKFFDFDGPLFHHLHLSDAAAKKVGRIGKPEGYYFPLQLNNHLGSFPHTYFGFSPETTIQQVRDLLLKYESRDNRITEISRAYRIQLGTGWFTCPGVLHAPGSVLTYEPQWNSDVNSVFENVSDNEIYPYEFLVENCPDNKKRDPDYILSLMDWEKNIDPHYKKHYFRPPILCSGYNEQYTEKWIMYGNDYVGAKELAILPGQSVIIKDPVAYGCVIIQGHGCFGLFDAEAAIMLRYGQPSADEFFVSEQAARTGIKITNKSKCEPMVLLKHFGPNHPDMPGHTIKT